MRERLRNLRELLRAGLWPAPLALSLAGWLLALLLVRLDAQAPIAPAPAGLFPGDLEAAREVLATIATAVSTIAGVAFSITLVALSVAATQYGNLVISSYLRDRVSQWVLGIFVGSFLYCLAVLANLHQGGGAPVPVRAVSAAILLAVAALAGFIALIHQLTQLMQAERIVAEVGEETLGWIKRMFPGEPPARLSPPELPAGPGRWVQARRTGYLQAISLDALMRLAQRRDLMLELLVRPGDFLSAGTPVARIYGPGAGERVAARAAQQFVIDERRTPTQDPEYGIHQLSQVGVRALSPSINDPYTALTCIDWLEAVLRAAACGRPLPRYRCDGAGTPRLIVPVVEFPLLAAAAFNKLGEASQGHCSILLRLMRSAGNLAAEFPDPALREPLREQFERLREAAALLPLESDRRRCAAVAAEMGSLLQGAGSAGERSGA